MDYYSTLGLQRNASEDDIKKAYRKMAMKHHPDRGGDEKQFKQVSEAYEILSDPQKKQMVDMGVDPKAQQAGGHRHQQGPFEFHFNTGNFEDVFSNFGFGGGGPFGFGGRQPQRNKTINITVDLSLEDVLKGKDLDAELAVPGGRKKIINISIPSGIEGGQQIRYQGMGDASIQGIPPGDLIVNIRVAPHPIFRREGDALIIEKNISVWEAILGCTLDLQTLDGKKLTITVPPGTQPETVLSCRNEGLPNMRNRQRGNLLINIKVVIPRNLTAAQIAAVENCKNGF
jgi:DnaJ-class molecular chaperone